jgi:citrate synthase
VRLLESVLVSLADHGLTPTAISARLTLLSAPESVQGALAAGLLGGGSRFLGVTEDVGRFLGEVLRGREQLPQDDDEEGWNRLALSAVHAANDAGHHLPGLGHPVHKRLDPRAPRLIAIAREEQLVGPHLLLLEGVDRVHERVLGRRLPLNGAGVAGAVLTDIGVPLQSLRGFSLLARAAGLLGHLAEEARRPIAERIYMAVDRRTDYHAP